MDVVITIGEQVTLTWRGHPVPIVAHKAQVMVARLALSRQPVSRTTLALELWGQAKRNNLRQLIYRMKKLTGAEEWLVEHPTGLHVRARVDVVPGWEHFVDQSGLDFLTGALTPELDTAALSELLAATEREDLALLAAALGTTEAAVFRALPQARARPTPATAAAHQRLAEVCADPRQRATHLLAADLPDSAAQALSDAGDHTAWRRARDPLLRGQLVREAMNDVERGPLDIHAEAVAALVKIQHQDPRTAAELDVRRAVLAMRQNQLEVSLNLAIEALVMAKHGGWPSIEHRARLTLGQLAIHDGDHKAALSHFEQLRPTNDEERLLCFAAQGAGLGLLGRVNEALVAHREALALARRCGDSRRVAQALLNVGSDLVRLGEFQTATVRFCDAAALSDGVIGARARSNAAMSAHAGGDLGGCRELVVEAIRAARAVESSLDLGIALDTRAALEAACGRLEEAVHWAKRAQAAHQKAGSRARAKLSEFNGLCWGSHVQRALQAIEALHTMQRPLLAALARLDLGQWCPLDHVPELLLAPLPSDVSRAHRAQLELVRARIERPSEELSWFAARPSHVQPLAAVACKAWGLASPSVRDVIEQRSVGLLHAQAHALRARVAQFGASMSGQSSTTPPSPLPAR